MDDKRDLAPDVSLPQADVTLPDGQHLQAGVVRRRRDRSGMWWYDLEIELPDRVENGMNCIWRNTARPKRTRISLAR
ncbi:hypothetical protein ACPCUV_29600 [Streptomyces platensis]|uniref:hypothetical protein n=1 Tax=Streptomyces platensis TaxID=58346 RepID=UPI003C2D5E7F